MLPEFSDADPDAQINITSSKTMEMQLNKQTEQIKRKSMQIYHK